MHVSKFYSIVPIGQVQDGAFSLSPLQTVQVVGSVHRSHWFAQTLFNNLQFIFIKYFISKFN